MELVAKVSQNMRQIRIQKRGKPCTMIISTRDAQEHWEKGIVTKTNAIFRRLVEHDFDVERTLEYYRSRT